MKTLNSKVAIVIGASKGIGVGIARVLAEKGASVIIAARHEISLKQAQKFIFEKTGYRVDIVLTNITKRKEVSNLFYYFLN